MLVSEDSHFEPLYNCMMQFILNNCAGGQNILELFSSSLSQHAVEQVLKVVPLEKSEEFYCLYLHDFVSHLALDIEDTDNGIKVA